jgi:HK97 family phage portal protein
MRSAPKVLSGGGGGAIDLLSVFRAKGATGKWVSRDTALTISALYRAAKIFADVAAGMPIHTYSTNPDGSKRPVKQPAHSFIWGRPNPEANRFVFWNTVFGHLLLNGNGIFYVVGVPDQPTRRAVELWPIDPNRVDIKRAPDGTKMYVIDGITPAKDWTNGGEIVHVQGWGTDGLKGLSLVQLGAMGFGLALAAEEFAAGFFGKGSLPGGYLASDQPLSAAQAKELSDKWEELHRGAENAHRLAVLGKGTKWMTTSLDMGDAQVIEARKFQVADVSRWTGIPEHLLGSHDKQSSWGTGLSEQNRGLLTYTIDPSLVNVELTVSDELLRPASVYMKFERAGLLRGTPKEQADVFGVYRQNGIMSPNEIRALLDMEPREGGDDYSNPNITPGPTAPPPTDAPEEPAPTGA